MSLHSPLLDTDELGDDHTAFPPPTRAARLQNVILASSPGYTPPAARPITPKTLLVRSATTSPAAAAIPQAVPVHRVTHSPSRHHLYPSGSPIFPLAPLAAPVPAWNAMGLARSRGGSAAGLAGSSSNTMVASVPSRPIYLSSTPPPATFAELRLAQMNASPKHIMSRQHQIAKQARGDGKTPRGSDDESDSDDLGPTPPNGHRTISITSASTVSTLPTRTVALTSISAAEVPSPKEELRSIWRLGWPVAMALLFRIAMSVTDVAVLGHKDTDFLAAAASALIWTNVTSAFLYRAYGSALSTLCSQSYGAGNFQLVGYWLQQGLVFSTVSSLFVAVLWWFTADVLRLIAIDSDIAALGGTFARWSILWLLPQIWMECLQRYFQSIHVIFPALVLNAVFVVVNAGLNLLLIFGLPSGWFPSFLSSSIHSDGWSGLGFIGSPIATAISRWLMLICFWVYTCVYKRYHAQTWGEGWNLTRTAAMHPQRVRQYLLQQCLPSAIGVCLEEFNLQIVAIFATHLGPSDETG
jgi:hypothetical protein